MDINETFGRMVKQVFGESARLAGTIGTVRHPGRLDIIVGDRLVGSGSTFASALQDASATITSCEPQKAVRCVPGPSWAAKRASGRLAGNSAGRADG